MGQRHPPRPVPYISKTDVATVLNITPNPSGEAQLDQTIPAAAYSNGTCAAVRNEGPKPSPYPASSSGSNSHPDSRLTG